ncbi:MAG: DMT family transporter [Acidobacteria bacterium]|nr:DMT family transporter [Acidobacteriota bacterium]
MTEGARPADALPGFLAAGACTLIWGANYSMAKRLLLEVDPLAVAWVRAASGMLFFGILLLARTGWRSLLPGLRRAAPLGFLGIFANQILFLSGLKRTSAAHSAIMIALLPVFVLLLSALERFEPVSLSKVAGILVAFAGVSVIAFERGVDFYGSYTRGDLLTLAGVMAFAAYTVFGKPALRDLGPLRLTGLAFLTGGAGIVLVAFPAAVREDWRAVSSTAAWCLAGVVVLSTIVAYILYYFALSRIDPSKVGAMMYLQPVVAAVIAYFIAGETFSAPFLLGGGMVLSGVVLTERG